VTLSFAELNPQKLLDTSRSALLFGVYPYFYAEVRSGPINVPEQTLQIWRPGVKHWFKTLKESPYTPETG
jgi:hypothetical protein